MMSTNKALRMKAIREARKLISSIYDKEEEVVEEIQVQNPDSFESNVDHYITHNRNSESTEFDLSYSNESYNVNCESADSSSSDDEDSMPANAEDILISDNTDLVLKLSAWAIKHNIGYEATNELLQILRNANINVPKDSRTLKKTPTDAESIQIDGGLYIHYGVEDCLTDFLIKSKNTFLLNDEIIIDINIDGLPISKSSNKQLWPILLSVVDTKDVLLVGVFEGHSKPHSQEQFLRLFINEMCKIMEKGFAFENKIFNVKLRSFICDAPARSFLLNVKGHTGYYSCVKCIQKGEYFKNKVVFQSPENELRTDESFRQKSHPEHHNNLLPIPLEKLKIDIVESISLDYMHIVCLGVMKTLLNAWTRVKGEDYSLTTHKIKQLNEKLLSLNTCITKEFARKPRNISEVDKWKATELRQFLLYTGQFVLKGILSDSRYDHFLLLSLALRLLVDKDSCLQYNQKAKDYLNKFVQDVPLLYNLSFLTCNFHSLLHLSHTVRRLGNLESISAFKFENYLQQIKKMVRKSNYAAMQVYRRHVEKSFSSIGNSPPKHFVFGKIQNEFYLDIFISGSYFSLKKPNNMCLTKGNVVKITKIFKKNDIPHFEGIVINNLRPLFMRPDESAFFRIYVTDNLQSENINTFSYQEISNKILCLEYNNETCFLPLIHETENKKWRMKF